MTTENALQQIKVNKAVGPDNVPAWVLRDNASTLAAPLTALFNTSLRDGEIRIRIRISLFQDIQTLTYKEQMKHEQNNEVNSKLQFKII